MAVKPTTKPANIAVSYPLSVSVAPKYGFTQEELALIIARAPEGVTDNEVAMFLYQSHRTSLSPLSNQIYLVGRWNKNEGRNVGTVQTGIDGYRLIADRTGRYAGSDDPVFNDELTQYQFLKTKEDHPQTATVTVYKLVGEMSNPMRVPYTATATWDAYAPQGAQGYMWNKMPLLMLGKVAEALALRKAFPAELSGIYTSEEMMQAGEVSNDATIEAMAKDLGYLNPQAGPVIAKLSSVGIVENDGALSEVIGSSVSEVENTELGSNILRAVWRFATAIGNGKETGEALSSLAKSVAELKEKA